jgi:hypothetical protein
VDFPHLALSDSHTNLLWKHLETYLKIMPHKNGTEVEGGKIEEIN